MALLFDEDYQILEASGLEYDEDETQRFLVIKNFPLTNDLYVHSGVDLEQVEVLWVVPSDYNTSGGDMFWVHPALSRGDGQEIPSVLVVAMPAISRGKNTAGGHVIGIVPHGNPKPTTSKRFLTELNGR